MSRNGADLFEGDPEFVWTVSGLVQTASRLLQEAFPTVVVQGEVGDVSRPRSGHLYFTLKDEGAKLPAVLFRGDRMRIPYDLKQGETVLCRGRLSIYVQGGRFQLYVSWFEPAGLGRLMADLERLKAKLQAEGLFDESRKKPLPRFPNVVGVVTSPTGAAIRDILKVIRRRWPARVVLSPTLVQGESAPDEIVAALERLWKSVPVDVIICGRGGGSLEDLWAFNDERVVRAVAACPVPIVSAVGHERDWVLSDLAADARAATPSAAAELVVPDRWEVRRRVGGLGAMLVRIMESYVARHRSHLELVREKLLRRADFRFEPRQRLADLETTLLKAQEHFLRVRRERLKLLVGKVTSAHPLRRLGRDRARLAEMGAGLQSAMSAKLAGRRKHMEYLRGRLGALDPHGVLNRGYALLLREDGKPVTGWRQVEVGDRVTARLRDGRLFFSVLGRKAQELVESRGSGVEDEDPWANNVSS